jgi:hypothetical protein
VEETGERSGCGTESVPPKGGEKYYKNSIIIKLKKY